MSDAERVFQILLVKRSGAAASRFCEVLQRAGYRVVHSDRAADAERLCRESRFDLLLCDLDVPAGHETPRLRKMLEDGLIRGIAMSRLARACDRAASLQAGFSAHLAKPMTARTLVATVRRVLGSRTPAELNAQGA
jgi:DNA-binding response OmpR family regulator